MPGPTVDGFNLTGKRALVVGAETPAGRAIAGGLAEAGAKLALASGLGYGEGQSKPALPSGNGLSDAVGLTDSGSESDLIREAVAELGGLDILANAGDTRQAGPFEELADGDLDRLISANLTGPIRLIRAAGRAMLADGKGGRIIQVASMLGERGVPHTATYGATQAGLLALIKSLSLEWARQGIRVNGIGLGWMERDPLLEAAGASADRLLRYLPTKRLGRASEVGAIAVYLASDQADMMTGQTLWVDGAVMSHA
jgi:NAD(P)-dependent dehydrogenase (short-subunit alcohol dehydrogenase family)